MEKATQLEYARQKVTLRVEAKVILRKVKQKGMGGQDHSQGGDEVHRTRARDKVGKETVKVRVTRASAGRVGK